jgi:hypothetical protein
MAATSFQLTSALVLKTNVGKDANGNDVYKNITFKKVKASAADQDVFDIARAIGLVLGAAVDNILRQDLNELIGA